MNFAGYRTVILLPGVGRMVAAGALGRLAYGVVPFAVVVANAQAHGFAVAGVASAAFGFPIAVLGPTRGRLVDRHGTKILLTFTTACLVLLVVSALLLPHTPWPVTTVLIGLAGALAPPLSGVVRTTWSRLIPDKEQLQQIHSLDSIAEETTFTVAPLLTTGLLHLFAATTCVIVGAALLIPCMLTLALWGQVGDNSDAEPSTAPTPHPPGSLLRRSSGQGIVLPIIALGLVGGSLAVLLPAGAAKGGDIASAGFPFALFSLGGVVGGLLHGRRKWQTSLRSQYLYATLMLTAGTVLLVPFVSTAVVLPAIFIAGLAMTPMYVIAYLLIDQHVEKNRHTEANSWIGSGYNVGSAGGAVAIGLLISHTGVTGGAAVAAAAAALGTLSILRIPHSTAPNTGDPASKIAQA